jgi:hypothetical protein
MARLVPRWTRRQVVEHGFTSTGIVDQTKD